MELYEYTLKYTLKGLCARFNILHLHVFHVPHVSIRSQNSVTIKTFPYGCVGPKLRTRERVRGVQNADLMMAPRSDAFNRLWYMSTVENS